MWHSVKWWTKEITCALLLASVFGFCFGLYLVSTTDGGIAW
jgi:hypothetical protein